MGDINVDDLPLPAGLADQEVAVEEAPPVPEPPPPNGRRRNARTQIVETFAQRLAAGGRIIGARERREEIRRQRQMQ